MRRRKDKPSLKQKQTNQLTPDQLRQLFFAKCKDREHLYEWIKLFWGVNLPKTAISRYSNCNPLDAVWDVYKACVWDRKGLDVLYIAPRGGGKTLGVAITESALMFHDKRGSVHIGAIEKQAKRAYSYFQTFLQKNREILSQLVEKSVIEKTTIIIDNEPITLECLPTTIQSLNGPHEACEDPDSVIALEDGKFTELKNINIGDGLSSFKTSENVFSTVTVIDKKETLQPSYKITLSNGTTMIAASFHRYLSKQGWVAVEDIGIDVCLASILNPKVTELKVENNFVKLSTQQIKEAQIGMILGDSHIYKRRFPATRKIDRPEYGNPAIVTVHGIKQEEYLRYKSKLINAKVTDKHIQTSFGGTTITASTGHTVDNNWLYDLFIQDRKKVIRPEIIDHFTEVSLAFWFMDDGCCSTKNRAELSTHSFSEEECNILIKCLEKVGVVGFIYPVIRKEKAFYTIRFDVENSSLLCKKIAPYIPQSMAYKCFHKKPTIYKSFINGDQVTTNNSGYCHEYPFDNRNSLKWLNVVHVEFVGVQKLVTLKVDSPLYGDMNYISNSLISHNCVVSDELDTLSPEGLQAYKQISGISVRHRLTGAPPVKIGISTRKSAYGLVQKQMDTAEAQGRSIKIWNQIDLTEKCTPERHGKGDVTIFVDQMKMHHIPKEEFDKLTEDKQRDYIAHQATEGCLKCPLFSCCLGDLKNQDPEMTAEKSTMITCIDDLITRIKGADTDWVLAELMCLKPSTEGIVFKEFDKSRHVASWDKMWEMLTKEKPTFPVDEGKFVAELHRRKVPIYGGMDWGWTAPSTLVVLAVDQDDHVYVLRAFGLTKTNDPTFIHLVKSKFHRYYRVQMYYPDVANGSAVDLMKSAGLPVASKIDKSENLGVQVIKRVMNVPGTSEVKFLVSSENCNMLIHELERYHYEKDGAGETIDGKFAKEYDHCFIPGTLVNTISGIKPIENVIEGDLVLSHDGAYHVVEGVASRDYSGEVVTIRPKGGLPFTCTPEHPILSQRFDRFVGQEGICQLTGQLRPIGNTEWILAGDLSHSPKYQSQVRVLTPIIKEKNDNHYVYDQLQYFPHWIEANNLVHPARITKMGKQVQSPTGYWSQRFVEVDEDFAFFLGWYAAEGATSKRSGQVTLACHANESTIIPLMNRISKKLNFTFKFFKLTYSNNGMCFSINSSFLRVILSELGVGNAKKYPDWLLLQSRSIITSFLGGYLFGDGSFTEGRALCNSTSPHLIQNTYLAMIKLGYKASTKPIPKREGQFQYGCGISYVDTNLFLNELFEINDFKDIFSGKNVLKVIPKATSCSTHLSDEYLSRSISYVSRSIYKGKVYNLHVKDTNTYCVNGIIVHNCIDPVRYILTAVLGKARFVMATDGMSMVQENQLRAEDGSYSRVPNFYELAQEYNIAVMPPDSKPFNRDNNDDDSPDGFMWGF